MCMSSSPNIPAPPPPPQEVKQPSQQALTESARKNRNPGAMSGGSLLTGPSGVANAATAKTTLLGQ